MKGELKNMEKTQMLHGNTEWFVRDRFGLFIHWGLYAMPARGEWGKQTEEMSDEMYDAYFKYFDPDLYDPKLWAQAAANAGMKYFVATTKHHDGFCLWDSKLTDYKSTNTPAKRDLLTPMVDAFRSHDMRVGLYHSLIDWHHPDFVIDDVHSMRNHPDREKLNKNRDQAKYIAYLHGQVKELLTQFGQIDVLWFDFSYPKGIVPGVNGIGKGREDWKSSELLQLIRRLQPEIVLNDRLDLDDSWDVKTPEQCQPREWVKVKGKPVVWEACQTISGLWGYNRVVVSWKSTEQLIQMLIDTVSKGGNLLLNAGPTGRGEFDRHTLDRLNGIGEWMKRHSRSIYGCTEAPSQFVAPQDCRLTYNPEKNRMYVHIFAWPFLQLHLDGFKDKVAYAQLLNDASELKMTVPAESDQSPGSIGKNTLTLELLSKKPDVTVPVVELFMK